MLKVRERAHICRDSKHIDGSKNSDADRNFDYTKKIACTLSQGYHVLLDKSTSLERKSC